MHYLLINRGTNRKRKTIVAVKSGIRSGVTDHPVGSSVDHESRNAGLDHLAKLSQHFAHQPPRSAHFVDLS